MQSREPRTDVRPARRRGARARNRSFGLDRMQRRSGLDSEDARTPGLPAPLLTAPTDLEDTAEWPERPVGAVRSIDISDGPKLIHRPDPPRRTAETPFPPKQRTAPPATVEPMPVPRPRPAVGGLTQVPDPVRLLTEAPRTTEALLATVLCLATTAVARVTGAPVAALVPLSALPAVGLLALALPGGPAARAARAVALLTAGAGLACLSPDLAVAALIVAVGVTVIYPSVSGARAGRIVAALAALSLLAPLAVSRAAGPTAVLLAGAALVALLGTHMLGLQRALVRAVTTALVRDRSARTAAARLDHARAHDASTGLATRDTLLRTLMTALETGNLATRPVGVVVVDLERFGAIADHHGAAIADQVAEEIGRRLREHEGAARLSRSRFALMVRDASADHCAGTARAVAARLAEPVVLRDRELTVTAAIGAALSGPALCTATDLLQGAEEAAGAARDHGAARWLLFDPALRAAAQARVALEEELRTAVRNRHIEAVFQPVLALGSGRLSDNRADDRIVGAEVLPRWVRADDTEIEPARFLPMARQLGLDRELGLQLVDAALDALVAWRREGLGVDQVWVTVPSGVLAERGFAHELTARLAVRGLSPSSVIVQVPADTAAIAEAEPALGLLRSLGIAVALVDVRADGASLDALRRLPVSAVRLDRVLTSELDHSDAVPRGIAELCRSLALRVVMTGVDTLDQLEGVRRIAAHAAQGHAIARALSAEDVTNLLSLRLPREFRL
jgi:diguanylate cyclase (GGDEF)-like protein